MIERRREYYRGVPMAPYDLVKEALIAFAVVFVLVIVLAAVFSSPDEPPTTLRSLAQDRPLTFLSVAISELDGSNEISTYGPPYNNGTDSVQYIGPISLQQLVGVHIPINTAQDFVLNPLEQVARTNVAVAGALKVFQSASSQQQSAWEEAYSTALGKATERNGVVLIPPGNYGPVGIMMSAMLAEGQSGGLDGLLLTSGQFYQTDYTKPLLFIVGDPLDDRATALHLQGTQWGMMNETGSYPGQAWLWLYTFWYQIPPYSTSPNGDLLVWLTMAVLTLILILVPYIPGLNRLPRYLGLYRVIWRDYYRTQRRQAPVESGKGGPV